MPASCSHSGVSSAQKPQDCRHTFTIHRCGDCSSIDQFDGVSECTLEVNGFDARVAALRVSMSI